MRHCKAKFGKATLFSTAIVRNISLGYPKCISSHPLHHQLSFEKAKLQHQAYVNSLKELGLEVIILDQDPNQPDCCFVEDTAVIFRNKAIITNMGAEDRRGEISPVKAVLEDFFPVYLMEPPATLEGGDVITLENYFISGISSRSNREGVNALSKFFGVKVDVVEDPSIVHLKSYVCNIGNNILVCTTKFQNHPALTKYDKIIIPVRESYAVNMININGTLLIAEGYPKTHKILKGAGIEIIILETSEFQKCDGALTCLSLRF